MADSVQRKPGEAPASAPSEPPSGGSSDGPSDARRRDVYSLSGHIDQNIESIVSLQRREWETVSLSQRRVERLSRFIGRPIYLIGLLGIVAAWVVYNSTAAVWGLNPFDAPPFELLDGIMSLIALITTTIVLIAQNRQAKLEQQHTHLALQVNLLTEQKVTKLIHLIEELRRDLPMVKDRHDAQATALQERADTAQVVSAIEEVGLTRSLQETKPVKGNPAK
ncbi:MAG TPA: DUF1003 domain-containing protein [Steroidobacteraceae bacterium]|nr:DUF1003 domain-containing protein [Steroidobacteraceae bacterium]